MTAATVATPASSRIKGVFGNQQVLLLLVWFAMVAFFTWRNEIFFSTEVFGNVLNDWAPVILMAMGMTFVIISGGIDLSVGSTVGISGVIAAYAMKWLTANGWGQNTTLLLGFATASAVGILVGTINGLLITKAKIVPFISTLATLGAGAGMCIVLTGGGPIGDGPENAILLTVPKYGPFSEPVLLIIALLVFLGLVLHKSRFGRYTYAIGSNPFAARAAGINVDRHLRRIYRLSGWLASIGGFYLYLRLAGGAPTSGQGGELDAIAAVVIGGVALQGGVGRMSGTALGALILTTVTSGLIIIGVAANWKQVVVAILIAAAVFVQGARALGKKA